MKTKYFKKASLSEDGKDNLKILAGLSIPSAEKLLNWFEQQLMYPRMDSQDRIQIAQTTGESGETIQRCTSILKLFIDRIIDNDEKINDFYEDIKSLNIISSDIGYKTLDLIFVKIPDIVSKFRLLRRQKIAELSGNSILSSCSTSAVLKPILKKRFEYGTEKIEKYIPEIIGYCTMAQIELEKSGSEETFSFLMSADDFNRFISDLLALQAEMRQLENTSKKLLLN